MDSQASSVVLSTCGSAPKVRLYVKLVLMTGNSRSLPGCWRMVVLAQEGVVEAEVWNTIAPKMNPTM